MTDLHLTSQTGSPSLSLSETRDRDEADLARNPADQAAQAGEVEVSERLALQARAAHDMNGALGELLRARKFVPHSARLLYDLSTLEEQIGLYRDANTTAGELRALTPADPKVLYLAARIELDLGRLSDAEKDMRAYVETHPDDATAHYGLGRILQQAQQLPGARLEFQRSIELKPAQTESFYQLGQIALEAGEYADALALDAKVLARNPTHGGALTATGIAYYKTKQYPLAEQALQKAVSAAPEYQLGHYYYGLVLARLGKKEQSDQQLALASKMAEDTNRTEAQGLQLHP